MYWHIVLAISSVITLLASGHDVIHYTFSCKDLELSSEAVLSCKTYPRGLNCPSDHVVVSTVCLGDNPESSANLDADLCSVNNNTCLANFTHASRSSTYFETLLERCLWQKSHCSLNALGYEWLYPASCSDRDGYFDLVAAFHFVCIPSSLVFTLCHDDHHRTNTDLPHVGYIRSKNFPAEVNEEIICETTFLFEQPQGIQFTIQHIDLNNFIGDYVQLYTITTSGEIIEGPLYTGRIESHEIYTTGGGGFMIKYRQTRNGAVRGVLLSYELVQYVAPPSNPPSNTEVETSTGTASSTLPGPSFKLYVSSLMVVVIQMATFLT